MDIKKLFVDAKGLAGKYKFPVLIVIVGLLLMAIPTIKTEEKIPEETAMPVASDPLHQELASVLSHVQGAGAVKVLLTTTAGEETVYQTNVDQNNENTRSDTVILTRSDRDQLGLVRQVKAPVYRGAIIVCEGADSADVKFSLVDAVSKITGLRSDQISVLKMK
jgi:stage III sporulation protein AG